MDSSVKDELWQLYQKSSSVTHPLTTSGLIFIGCEECDIILQSPGVEKRHAVISYDTLKQEFWIKDLNSVTGTYINGVRIPEQSYFKLSHEDSIRFGYGPIFLLKKSTFETDTSKTEDDEEPTYLADSLEDIRESDLATSFGPIENSSGSSMASCSSPSETQPLANETNIKSPRNSIASPLNSYSRYYEQKTAPKEAIVLPYKTKESPNSPKQEQMLPPSDSESESLCNGKQNGHPSASAPMAFTIPFDSDSSSSSKTFTRRKPPNRVKENSATAIVNPTKSKVPQREEMMNGNPPNISPVGNLLGEKAPLTDAASYLIQRMLIDNRSESPLNSPTPRPWEIQKGTWIRPKKSSSTSSPHSASSSSPPVQSPEKKSPEKENEDDNKSETGTYTVETELNDPQVAEARNKIDEVFGLQKEISSKKNPPPPPLHHHFPEDIKLGFIQNDKKPERLRTTFVPVSENRLFSPTSKTSTFQEKFSNILTQKHTPEEIQRPPVVPPQRPPRSSVVKNAVQKHETPVLTSQSSLTLSSSVAPTVRRAGSLGGGSRDAWSDGSSPPQSRALSTSFHAGAGGGIRSNSLGGDRENFGCFWRRKSWNLSCSDLDADQNNKSETGSVISDISTSTEPSSHSSHSYGGRHQRTQDGPQMRLNRAFALRRARLGFESDDAIASSPAPQPIAPNTSNRSIASSRELPTRTMSHKSSVGNLNSNLSRQDGGRFSLRLPRNAATRIGRSLNSPSDSNNRSFIGGQPRQATSGWTSSNQKGIVYPSRRDPAPEKDKPIPSIDLMQKHKKEVSALDGLVITAVHQLSVKLRNSSCDLLSKERLNYPDKSEGRLMIDEVLPSTSEKKSLKQSNSNPNSNDGSLTRDLSAILKNLKKVEQTIEVLSTLGEHCPSGRPKEDRFCQRTKTNDTPPAKQKDPRSFFIVDV